MMRNLLWFWMIWKLCFQNKNKKEFMLLNVQMLELDVDSSTVSRRTAEYLLIYIGLDPTIPPVDNPELKKACSHVMNKMIADNLNKHVEELNWPKEALIVSATIEPHGYPRTRYWDTRTDRFERPHEFYKERT